MTVDMTNDQIMIMRSVQLPPSLEWRTVPGTAEILRDDFPDRLWVVRVRDQSIIGLVFTGFTAVHACVTDNGELRSMRPTQLLHWWRLPKAEARSRFKWTRVGERVR